MDKNFEYSEAFCRNLGWVTKEELKRLGSVKVAIGGAGGVGGIHLITLVRLGITQFHLADPDFFEMKNFNRQYGADMNSLGKNKCDVMLEKALAINPELKTKSFKDGITKANVAEFLDGPRYRRGDRPPDRRSAELRSPPQPTRCFATSSR